MWRYRLFFTASLLTGDDGTKGWFAFCSVAPAPCSSSSNSSSSGQRSRGFRAGALKQEVTLCHVLNKLDREGVVDRSVPHCLQSACCIGACNYVHTPRFYRKGRKQLKFELSRQTSLRPSQGGANKPGRSLEKRSCKRGNLLSPAKDNRLLDLKNGCKFNFGARRGVLRRISRKSSPETQQATDECEYRSCRL